MFDHMFDHIFRSNLCDFFQNELFRRDSAYQSFNNL